MIEQVWPVKRCDSLARLARSNLKRKYPLIFWTYLKVNNQKFIPETLPVKISCNGLAEIIVG